MSINFFKLDNYLRILDRKIMIVLEYFDPDVTFHIQLSDMGIIRSDKAYFRKDIV
jgi:hypothetical protein